MIFSASRSSGRFPVIAFTVLLLSSLCAAAETSAQASPTPQATLTTVASFNGANGEEPHAGVTFDSQGNLFGTTYGGGAGEVGAVYEIAKGSTTITDLASFDQSNGSDLEAGVTLDSHGNLFGTTYSGGTDNAGTVFEIAKGSGRIKTLDSFRGTNGSQPDAAVVFDRSGNLFGTTQSGGANSEGTVFEIAKGSRHIKTLASFSRSSGGSPYGVTLDAQGNLFGTTFNGGVRSDGRVYEIARGSTRIKTLSYFNRSSMFGPPGGARSAGSGPDVTVTFDRQGNLFGTTFGGGTDNAGVVYEIAEGSTYIKTVVSFDEAHGTQPQGSLTFDRQGNLFGTTSGGGPDNDGTVFEIIRGSTTITTVASFNGANGKSPSGVTFDRQGNLFGITFGGGTDDKGTVYEIAKGSTVITNLVFFTGTNGSIPSGVTFDRQGNLFGTTQSGGANNWGTVFEIARAGLSPAAPGSHSAAPKPPRKAALLLTALFLALLLGMSGLVLRARKRTRDTNAAD